VGTKDQAGGTAASSRRAAPTATKAKCTHTHIIQQHSTVVPHKT
jgi:hypothetical protein